MTKVIGVRFRTAGKIYFFSPGEFEIKQGDHVIVETARGIEYGRVVSAPKEVDDDSVVQPLKSVIRIATEQDEKTVEKNRQKEKEAFKICQEKIRKHGLDMKLIEAEYTFDNNKVLFYFTADGRIDFRELVKDLAAVFRTRIELRQIGVRDETKIRGGIGICGRPLCCSTYLTEFAAVSIKMAKEQNLSLNPTKISGVCGRLIPIFGAFIGCAVGCFLIFMVSPKQAILFIIVFLILQQIEGNLIYPHVVGGSVGLPSIWVLAAVTIGGNLMGIVGMLIFIPLVSVLYTIFREFVYLRLKEKNIKQVTKTVVEEYTTELNTIVSVTRPTLGTPAVPTDASVAVPITVI